MLLLLAMEVSFVSLETLVFSVDSLDMTRNMGRSSKSLVRTFDDIINAPHRSIAQRIFSMVVNDCVQYRDGDRPPTCQIKSEIANDDCDQ